MPRTGYLSVMLPDPLHAALRDLARQHGITQGAYVTYVLQSWVDQLRGQLPAPPSELVLKQRARKRRARPADADQPEPISASAEQYSIGHSTAQKLRALGLGHTAIIDRLEDFRGSATDVLMAAAACMGAGDDATASSLLALLPDADQPISSMPISADQPDADQRAPAPAHAPAAPAPAPTRKRARARDPR